MEGANTEVGRGGGRIAPLPSPQAKRLPAQLSRKMAKEQTQPAVAWQHQQAGACCMYGTGRDSGPSKDAEEYVRIALSAARDWHNHAK